MGRKGKGLNSGHRGDLGAQGKAGLKEEGQAWEVGKGRLSHHCPWRAMW